MLIPPPPPAYTLAPGLGRLTADQCRALDRALSGLTGRIGGVLVSRVHTAVGYHVLQMESRAGPILVVERARPAEGRIA